MRLPPASPQRRPHFYFWLLVALFAYLTFARVHESSTSFHLLRDQIRDWRIALGSFSALPLLGPQSTAGGSSLGPIYYWVLWTARCLVGPWTSNLPHAGAYGIALLQGGADLFLLDTIRRRTGSIWVALAAVLLVSTNPHELAMSSTIWNPAVSVAFVKLAIASRLRHDDTASLWWTAATTASAWFAVQAHSAAIFVAIPVTASYVVADLLAGRVRRSLEQVRAIVEVIVLLQIPFLLSALTQSSEVLPSRAIAGASDLLTGDGLRWRASFAALAQTLASILFAPWAMLKTSTAVLTLCVLVTAIRARRDIGLLSATIAPLVAAVAGLALWQGNYDSYWYVPFAPSAAITIALALTWWRPSVIGALIVFALLVAQPSRLAASHFEYRMKEYGPLLRGTERIVKQTKALRRLGTSFPMPPFSDETFLFGVLGGQLRDDAEFDAVIDEKGDVQFTRVSR